MYVAEALSSHQGYVFSVSKGVRSYRNRLPRVKYIENRGTKIEA